MPTTCLVADDEQPGSSSNYNVNWLSRSFSNYNNSFPLSRQNFAPFHFRTRFPLKVDTFASKYFKLSHYASGYFDP